MKKHPNSIGSLCFWVLSQTGSMRGRSNLMYKTDPIYFIEKEGSVLYIFLLKCLLPWKMAPNLIQSLQGTAKLGLHEVLGTIFIKETLNEIKFKKVYIL